MLDAVLINRNVKVGTRITIKTLVAFIVIVLALVLPQLVHLVAGASGGVTYLPMYLPVLIGGCILGTWWGLGVGILSPLVSYLFTSFLSNPMPALTRLPFMMAELGIFALITGLFSKKIVCNKWLAFPAVILAQVAGRLTFLGLVFIFQSLTNLSVGLVWSQIQTGLIGIIIQILLVPVIIIGISKLLKLEKNEQ